MCKQERPLGDFPRSKNRKDGHGTRCKTCQREYSKQWYKRNRAKRNEQTKTYYQQNERQFRENAYRSKYGIGVEDYERMVEEQKGVCALCSKPEAAKDGRSGRVRRLAVDHCHETEKVRGLLCYRCNHLIGCLGDNLEAAERLVRYMKGR
jgi:hypothetical protein